MSAIIDNRFGPCVYCGVGPDNHRDDAGHPYEAAQEFDISDTCPCGDADCTTMFGGICYQSIGGEGGGE